MALIKDAATCHACGGDTSLKHGVYCEDLRKEAYQVFCLSCDCRYAPSECAIEALQNARGRKMEEENGGTIFAP